ncbi:MAG: beta strand repeat-containing protein, partial [Planctomycetota bacterium]
MRRLASRLFARLNRSLVLRRRQAERRKLRRLGCETLEGRRQLASITLTLDTDGLLSLVDSDVDGSVANDAVLVTYDNVKVSIDLGAGNPFDAASTDFGISGGIVEYSADNTVATIAKTAIQGVSIVLDNTLLGGGQDIVTGSIAEGSSLTSIMLPTTAITADVLSFTDSLELEGDLAIVVDNLTVDGTIQGQFNVSVTASDAAFRGQLGTTSDPLGDGVGVSLQLTGPGVFSFLSDVNLANGAVADNSTAIVFIGDFASSAGDTTLEGNVSIEGDSFLSEGGLIIGSAGSDPRNELRITSENATVIRSVSSGVTIHAAIVLEADLELDAASAGLELNGPVNGLATGAQSLHLNSPGPTTISGSVGAGVPLRAIVTDAPGSTMLGANATVQGGNSTFNDPVTLVADVTLVGSSGSKIEFNQTVDGASSGGNSLTLDCPGGSYFAAAVGPVVPVGIESSGPAIAVLAGVAVFDSSVATKSGFIQDNLAGLVTFHGNVSLDSGDIASDFAGNVLLTGIVFSSSGHVTFGSDSSDTLRFQGVLNTVTRMAPAAGVIFTVNATTTLVSDLTIQAGNGDIVINGAIDAFIAGMPNLVLNSAGETRVNAAIGGNAAVRSITTDGAGSGITLLAANVSVGAGGASFNDAVTLSGDISMIALGGSANFARRVTGGDSLTLDVGGSTTFAAELGGTGVGEAIGDGSGEALVILSAGNTVFRNDVVTNSGIRQSATAGLVVFGRNVTIGEGDAADGVASTFDGDVELQGSQFAAARDVRFGTPAGGNTLTLSTNSVAIRTVDNDGGIVFAATVDGPQSLTIAAQGDGDIEFQQAVGGDSPPLSLTIEGADTISFQADATIANDARATAAGNITVGRTLASLAGTVQLVTTLGGGGSINFESLSAAVLVDLRSDNAVQLVLPDRIATDISAPSIRVTASNGIGASVPLKTVTSTLAASNSGSGDIRILNTGAATLNLGEILGLSGVVNAASGSVVSIRTDNLLQVSRTVTALGSVSLTTLDTVDDNSILIASAIASTNSTVSVSSGDNITLLAPHSITAAGKITLAGDTASVDGSAISVEGLIRSMAATAESIAIITGGGSDTVRISGQLQTNSTTADAILISVGAGNDQLAIDSNGGTATNGGTVAGLLSRLTYRAGTGSDSLTLDNSGRTTAQAVTVLPLASVAGLFAGAIGTGPLDTYFATGKNISYDNVEDITLSTGTGNDTIDATAFFNSATARRTNIAFAENPSATDSDTLSLNFMAFPEGSSPYVLATTARGRALAGVDASGRQFGSLRWDDIESVQAVVPRIANAIPANALFLAGRTLFNDIARYAGTTELVTLNVNGINFESHEGIQSLIAYGRSGNDQIRVDNPAIAIPVEFRGEQGADFLSGGAAA